MIGLGSPALDAAYDRWKTTPPEEPESKLKCYECKEELYPGDKIYRLDDDIYCRHCAFRWLDEISEEATYEMCFDE